MKQPTTNPTNEIQVLKNQVTFLEDLLKDGAGPIKAYPIPARQKEKTTYMDQLTEINEFNPGVIQNLLVEIQTLHLNALGKSHLQAVMETMQELSDNHPQEYQQALRRIDIDHNFFFDIETDDSLDFIFNVDGIDG